MHWLYFFFYLHDLVYNGIVCGKSAERVFLYLNTYIGNAGISGCGELTLCGGRNLQPVTGGKWKLLIIRNLKSRPWRFNELQRDLEGISQSVAVGCGIRA